MNHVRNETDASSILATVEDDVLHLIDLALAEDAGSGDVTSKWIVPARTRVQAEIVAKADGVIAGITPARAVFLRLDPRVDSNVLVDDGVRVSGGDVVLTVVGPGRAILTGERIALNFLQRLSGVATVTRRFVDAIAGTSTRILDTRKTTPAWRTLEKAAVRAGGGVNHRQGLFDAVLIKDNHIAIAGSIPEAIRRIREHNTKGLPIIVEVRTLDELDAALDEQVDRLLLDNMNTGMMREAVRRTRARENPPALEASGNMSVDRVAEVARTGVDFISVGALTHSAPALDLSLRILRP